jgi:hypothetical protein
MNIMAKNFDDVCADLKELKRSSLKPISIDEYLKTHDTELSDLEKAGLKYIF